MTQFIVKNIVLIHSGTLIMKLKSTFLLALIGSPFLILTEKILEWYHLNFGFILFVLGAIGLDHVLGTVIHAFIKRDFSIKSNLIGLLTKVSLVVLVFFVGEGLLYILGSDNLVANYFETVLKLMVFLYPAGSLIFNVSFVTNGKFPPVGFLNKISKFNKNLNLDSFTKNVKSNNNQEVE